MVMRGPDGIRGRIPALGKEREQNWIAQKIAPAWPCGDASAVEGKAKAYLAMVSRFSWSCNAENGLWKSGSVRRCRPSAGLSG